MPMFHRVIHVVLARPAHRVLQMAAAAMPGAATLVVRGLLGNK